MAWTFPYVHVTASRYKPQCRILLEFIRTSWNWRLSNLCTFYFPAINNTNGNSENFRNGNDTGDINP
jgi:hypothetical protein